MSFVKLFLFFHIRVWYMYDRVHIRLEKWVDLMKIFLLKDIARIGMAGEMISVADGYARNFILPRKLGIEVTPEREKSFVHRARHIEKRQEVIETQTSMLAEHIKSLTLTLLAKVHDGDKLYGAIGQADIVDLLKQKGINLAKNQVIIDKAIKKVGSYPITIKLSSRLKPAVTLKVIAER